MAAACKTCKPDLVAIYRLEFYKKQKNWKFCTLERKKEEERKKAAKNAKAKLNQTYNIEPAPERDKDTSEKEKEVKPDEAEKVPPEEVQMQDAETAPAEEETDNLNDAFVDTETDDYSTPTVDPPTGPYSPKWSVQQWAARCRPWESEPSCPDAQFVQSVPDQHPVWSDPAPYTSDHTQSYHVQEANLGQALTDYEADLLFKRKNTPCPDTNVPHGAMLDTGNACAWEPRGGAGCWPQHSQVWTNQKEGWFEEIYDIQEEAVEAIEALKLAEAEAGAGADAVDCAGAEGPLERAGWLGSSASLDKGAIYRSDSLPSVSSGSFMRGASLAAHSTQLELAEAEAGAGAEAEAEAAAGAVAMTAAALATAVAEHATALRALLGEAKRRQLPVSPLPAELYSFDEYPTRDVGPTYDTPPPPPLVPTTCSSAYTHNPTFINDVFVAGSYKNRPDSCGQTEKAGRGRGRKVVGIEMGRPYRL